MTTPTNENRDTDRFIDRDIYRPEPEPRPRLDLSVTKVAAGAGAAALAAAVGSKLGVAGTIVGSAVASVVATSAGALIGHSLERGKTAARKAAALTRIDEAPLKHSLTDWALADSALDETVATSSASARTWKDRIPGRKPLLAAAIASFVLGTGAVTALEVARKGEFPGYHSNVFTDPGQTGGSHQSPDPRYPGTTHKGSTPSQKPDSSATSGSGSGPSSSAPSSVPSTPSPSGSTPSSPSTPSTSPSTNPSTSPSSAATTPSTAPSTPATGSTAPATAPSSSGGGATTGQ